MSHEELRIPLIEILVAASDFEVARVCFYGRDDIHEGFDVVTFVSGKTAHAVIEQVLKDALQALRHSDWYNVDELRSLVDEEVEDPPF